MMGFLESVVGASRLGAVDWARASDTVDREIAKPSAKKVRAELSPVRVEMIALGRDPVVR
jgi:hypothetical protein